MRWIEYGMRWKSHGKQTNVTPQTYVLRGRIGAPSRCGSTVLVRYSWRSCCYDSTRVRWVQGVDVRAEQPGTAFSGGDGDLGCCAAWEAEGSHGRTSRCLCGSVVRGLLGEGRSKSGPRYGGPPNEREARNGLHRDLEYTKTTKKAYSHWSLITRHAGSGA